MNKSSAVLVSAVLLALAWHFRSNGFAPILVGVAAAALAATLSEIVVVGLPSRDSYPWPLMSAWRFCRIDEAQYAEVKTMAMTDANVHRYVLEVLNQGRDLNESEFFAIQTRIERISIEARAASRRAAGVEARAALRSS